MDLHRTWKFVSQKAWLRSAVVSRSNAPDLDPVLGAAGHHYLRVDRGVRRTLQQQPASPAAREHDPCPDPREAQPESGLVFGPTCPGNRDQYNGNMTPASTREKLSRRADAGRCSTRLTSPSGPRAAGIGPAIPFANLLD